MDSREVIAAYVPIGIEPAAAAFSRQAVGAAAPAGPARARCLLWVASRLGAWGIEVGLEPRPEVLLHPSVIERFVAVGLAEASVAGRRTARTNLRFLARRVAPALVAPAPVPLARSRAKAPYTPGEVAALLALAAAQPTEAGRQRLTALLCLGLGAGIERGELRALRGTDVIRRSGGVVVVVRGRCPRAVPVLDRYRGALLGAAAHAGGRFICGGVEATRKNLTTPLVARVAGGGDLPRLETGRLRATWLAEQLDRLGVPGLLRAAGVQHSQRIWDLAVVLDGGDEATLVARLG